MDYEYEVMLEEMMESGAAAGMVSNSFSTLLSIAVYVLTALALYDIAKRRGINNPWLSWIPVVNVWVVGCISDQYRYVAKGQVKSKRKVLIALGILLAVLAVIMAVVAIVMVVNLITMAIPGNFTESEMLEVVLGPVMGILGLCLPLVGVSIAYAVIYYMALYDIYTSMDPGNATTFLVLSILFGVTEPFFLFFNRQKDLGMPPRRPEPAYYEPPAYIPPQDEPKWEDQEN